MGSGVAEERTTTCEPDTCGFQSPLAKQDVFASSVLSSLPGNLG